jgi:hypothetical protein
VRRLALLTALAVLLLAAQPAGATAPVVGGTSFNDAAQLGPGAFADALDTGSTVFYKVHLSPGQRLNAGASLDVSGLDASLTGTSSLIVRVYNPLRAQATEGQTLGPGDAATHLKTTSAQLGPVKEAGDYFVSAGVNDFLPDAKQPVQLPLSLTVGVANGGGKAQAPIAKASTVKAGTSWAVLLVICLGAVLVGGAAGLAYRRR